VRAANLAYAIALFGATGPAGAQLTGHLSLLSDYIFRGESLSEDRPAVQAGLAYDHSSGLFIGALGSSVRVDPTVSGLGGEIYGGYAHPLGTRGSWDVGAISYMFPRPSSGPSYDYAELFVGAGIESISGRIFYSNDYFNFGAPGIYAEVNGSQLLGRGMRLVAHIGYLDRRVPRSRSADNSGHTYLDFKAGLGFDVSLLNIELAVVGSTAERGNCPAGTGHCNTRAVLSVSRSF
jgi:uncharacterized protein (TIGR02001 family)